MTELLQTRFGAGTKRGNTNSAARESGSANLAAAAEEQAHTPHDPHTLLVLTWFRWICGPRPEIVVAMSRYSSDVVSAASLDRLTIERLAAISNATQALEAPAAVPFQADSLWLELLHGWDGRRVDVLALAVDDEEVVGWGTARFSYWDNPTIAEFSLDVHPRHQRRGLGTLLLELLRRCSAERGRERLDGYGWAGASSEQFLPTRGFRVAQRAVQRRIEPASVDWWNIDLLLTSATRMSEAYELVPLVGRTPPDMVDNLVDVWAAINDAPLDDLQADPDEFSAARLHAFDSAMAARRQEVYRFLARRREDGAWAGHTVVCVDRHRPGVAFQEDTTVVSSHRGHRLGIRLKTAMLQWLRDVEPGLTTIDTWNAMSNTHMIAVNDAIGCRVVNHGIAWQTDTEPR
jgi:GNAT superfamily N-acetyltransferase